MSGRGVTIHDVRARRQEILRILHANGAMNPRVFGSVAQGTADDKSDIDLLVDLGDPRPRGFHYVGLIVDLEQQLAKLLGRPVHVTELEGTSPTFAARVQADAVAL